MSDTTPANPVNDTDTPEAPQRGPGGLVRVEIGGQRVNVSAATAARNNLHVIDDDPVRRYDGELRPAMTVADSVAAGDAVAPPADAAHGPGDSYDQWMVADLETEIERRNDDRPDDQRIAPKKPGNKPQLIAALRGDDA